MTDREKQQELYQTQLDVWKNDVEALKAKASVALESAQEALSTAQQAMERQLAFTNEIEVLEGQIKRAEAGLADLAAADDAAWESIKDGVETAWESLKSAVGKSSV